MSGVESSSSIRCVVLVGYEGIKSKRRSSQVVVILV